MNTEPTTIEEILAEANAPSILDQLDIPKVDTFKGEQYNQPVTMGGPPRPMPESEFLPANVLPIDAAQKRQHKKTLKQLANPSKVLVRGGKRVIHVDVQIPIEQHAGLQRFEGATDSDRINMLIRMGNRRVDEVQAKLVAERDADKQQTEGV